VVRHHEGDHLRAVNRRLSGRVVTENLSMLRGLGDVERLNSGTQLEAAKTIDRVDRAQTSEILEHDLPTTTRCGGCRPHRLLSGSFRRF
jgi:hypothetical protein